MSREREHGAHVRRGTGLIAAVLVSAMSLPVPRAAAQTELSSWLDDVFDVIFGSSGGSSGEAGGGRPTGVKDPIAGEVPPGIQSWPASLPQRRESLVLKPGLSPRAPDEARGIGRVEGTFEVEWEIGARADTYRVLALADGAVIADVLARLPSAAAARGADGAQHLAARWRPTPDGGASAFVTATLRVPPLASPPEPGACAYRPVEVWVEAEGVDAPLWALGPVRVEVGSPGCVEDAIRRAQAAALQRCEGQAGEAQRVCRAREKARALLSEGWVAEAVEALRRSEVDGERLPLVQLMAAPGYLPKVAPPERGSQSR